MRMESPAVKTPNSPPCDADAATVETERAWIGEYGKKCYVRLTLAVSQRPPPGPSDQGRSSGSRPNQRGLKGAFNCLL